MPNYRRNYVPGGTYFFTIVTDHRRKIFDTPKKLDLLLNTIRQVQRSKPFELLAYCLLPDHIHLLITFPEGDSDFPIRMREVKRLTTLWMRKELKGGVESIWQDKYWEHTIRDERDLQIHFDYIHYNPVKHSLSQRFDGWKWSSFRDYFDENDNRVETIDPERFKKYKFGFGE
ncbi:MAG TPA: transposase [Anaerolineaceae bacterium]|jgi:putative transposase|nr:transposase [Anaerolineaceae bacterium]